MSLAKLTDGKHEQKPLLPWNKDLSIYKKHIQDIEDGVAFYYLKYLKNLFNDFDLKVVCLKRDEYNTVQSYLRKTPNCNHWGKEFQNEWSRCYPSYNLPKREALEKYWNDYYSIASKWDNECREFKIFPIRSLNTVEGQEKILTHLDLDFDRFKKVHYNRGSFFRWLKKILI